MARRNSELKAVEVVEMGVPGFAAYVRPLGAPVTLQHGTQLLVDGSSLAFHVVNKLGSGAFREECGDYDAVHREVSDTVQGWLDAGFTVVVVADGPASAAKRATLQRRRRQRYAGFQLLLQHLRRNSRAARSSSLPPPPLFTVQVMASLLALERQQADRLQVVRARGEADTVLGRLCRDAGRAGRPAVVVGKDSDYLLMRGIRYVELASLGPGRAAVESSRERIAKLLGVREDAMTDLALALGNDFVVGDEELDLSACATKDRIDAALDALRAGDELELPEVVDVDAAEGLAETRIMYDNDLEFLPAQVQSPLEPAVEEEEAKAEVEAEPEAKPEAGTEQDDRVAELEARVADMAPRVAAMEALIKQSSAAADSAAESEAAAQDEQPRRSSPRRSN